MHVNATVAILILHVPRVSRLLCSTRVVPYMPNTMLLACKPQIKQSCVFSRQALFTEDKL